MATVSAYKAGIVQKRLNIPVNRLERTELVLSADTLNDLPIQRLREDDLFQLGISQNRRHYPESERTLGYLPSECFID